VVEALRGDRVTKADLCTELAETPSEIVRRVAGLNGFQTLAVTGIVIALARTVR
jgi:hypothetical protein